MILNKVLSNSRHLLSKNVLPVKTAGTLVRQRHVMSAPPRSPVSTGENIALGVLITLSMWCVPYWVLYYIPDYQQEDRHAYTGK